MSACPPDESGPINGRNTPSPPPQKKKLAKWRVCLRCLAAFILIPLLVTLLWLDIFGFPKTFHSKLVNIFNHDGLKIEFEKVHFSIFTGIKIRNGQIATHSPEGDISIPFKSASIGYGIKSGRIFPSKLKIDSGALIIHSTNPEGDHSWRLCDHVTTEIDLSKDDVTTIQYFRGSLANGQLKLNGTITNAWSSLAKSQISSKNTPILSRFGHWIEELSALEPLIGNSRPSLNITIAGDANHPPSLNAHLSLTLNHFKNKVFSAKGLVLDLHSPQVIEPNKRGSRNVILRAHCEQLEALSQSPWSITSPEITFSTTLKPSHPYHLNGKADQIQFSHDSIKDSSWIIASPQLSVAGTTTNDWSENAITSSIHKLSSSASSISEPSRSFLITQPDLTAEFMSGIFRSQILGRSFEYSEMQSDEFDVSLHFDNASQSLDWFRDQAGQWDSGSPTDKFRQLEHLSVSVNAIHVSNTEIGDLSLLPVEASNNSSISHRLELIQKDGEGLSLVTTHDSKDNSISIQGHTHIDVKKWNPLFGENLKDVLTRIGWDAAPKTNLQLGPAPIPQKFDADQLNHWLSQKANFHGDVIIGNGNFKGIPFLSLTTDFSFDNDFWKLSDIKITRPEGVLDLDFIQNDLTSAYTVDINGTIMVKALRPLFEDNSDYYFERISESGPMTGIIHVRGPWEEGLGLVEGTIDHPTLRWKDAQFSSAKGGFKYDDAKRTIEFHNLDLIQSTAEGVTPQTLKAQAITYDRNTEFLTLEGIEAFSTPQFIARSISDDPVEFLDDLGFDFPGTWSGGGTVHLKESPEINLNFSLDHTDFHLKKFKLGMFHTDISWINDQIDFENIAASPFSGTITGNTSINISDMESPKVILDLKGLNLNIQSLSQAISPDLDLKGSSDFSLTVTSGILHIPESWTGSGEIKLRDGVIWSIPLFGVLSKTVDSVLPGLGHSIIKTAQMTFSMQSEKIQFDTRLKGNRFGIESQGTLTTKGNIDALGKLRIFQADNPIEKLLNITLIPVTESLRFSISGSVKDPFIDPFYIIPRVILNPLNPTKWFK